MKGDPAVWSREDILADLGDSVVTARDDKAQPVALPASLGLVERDDADATWDQQTRDIYEPDMPEVARLWWQALEKPGVIQHTTARREARDGWRQIMLQILDLRHQDDIGCVLVASQDLGPCETPEHRSHLRDNSTGDAEVAWFERPIWLLQELDALGTVLDTEGDTEALFGRPAEELEGKIVLQFLHPDDHSAAIEMWSSLLSDPGSSRTIRQRIIRPDGSERWIESTVLNRLDSQRSGVLLSISHDVTERRRHERDLEHRALTDQLTNLPNRFSLDTSLESMLSDGPATVAFLDLDGFKSVNDQLGHRVGDTALEAIAARLSNTAPESAVVGRWGGDEFVLIAPGDCEDELRSAIEAAFADPISVGDDQWHPRCSYGVAHGDSSIEPDQLIRSADTAMYEAKERRAG